MKPSIEAKLTALAERLEEVTQLLSQEHLSHDLEQYRRLTREHAELLPVVETFQAWRRCLADLAAAEEMRLDASLKTFAEAEIAIAKEGQRELEKTLQAQLLPKDPNDNKNIYLEIRAGTGGDEAALFAADLLRMYIRFAERQRWQVEMIAESESDLGGYKEVIIHLSGEGVYAKLKFESGGHRVQRVPTTETQGRIHTSACTVAVMPEAEAIDEVNIQTSDLRIDTFRASGAGGQHINKTDSAVRITHIPSGLVVECQDDRSQHKNKARALAVLAARIMDARQRAAQAKEAATRKSLIGSGDRSERIRTYNFPQGRVTDHRINLTLYKLDTVMDGDLVELIQSLTAEHQAEELALMAADSL